MPFKHYRPITSYSIAINKQKEVKAFLTSAKEFLNPHMKEFVSIVRNKHNLKEDLYPVWSADGDKEIGINLSISLYTKEQYECCCPPFSPNVVGFTVVEVFKLELTDCLTDIPQLFQSFWGGLFKEINEGDEFIIIGEEEKTFKAQIVTPYGVFGLNEDYGDTWWAWDCIVAVL